MTKSLTSINYSVLSAKLRIILYIFLLLISTYDIWIEYITESRKKNTLNDIISHDKHWKHSLKKETVFVIKNGIAISMIVINTLSLQNILKYSESST